MGTLYLEELIRLLSDLKEQCGDVPVVLHDADTGWYLPLVKADFIEQVLEENDHRLVISCDYARYRETAPVNDALAGY